EPRHDARINFCLAPIRFRIGEMRRQLLRRRASIDGKKEGGLASHQEHDCARLSRLPSTGSENLFDGDMPFGNAVNFGLFFYEVDFREKPEMVRPDSWFFRISRCDYAVVGFLEKNRIVRDQVER